MAETFLTWSPPDVVREQRLTDIATITNNLLLNRMMGTTAAAATSNRTTPTRKKGS